MLTAAVIKVRTILLRQVTNRTTERTVALASANQMMHMTVQNRALLYSMVAAAMRFTRIAMGETAMSQLEKIVEARTITMLSQEMASQETALAEANIIAIIACGYCGETYPLRTGRLPRQSVLRELQDLNIYGRMVVVDAHVRGLKTIISILGGLQRLKTPGLAQLISL
jgi:hypothetical protein